MLYEVITVWADAFQFEETSLYTSGNAASIHISPDGKVFVVDEAIELWSVDGSTGEFNDYYPIGSSNLADIAFSSAANVWWANNLREFGSSHLSRITSYNVCYTKLLRAVQMANRQECG